MAEQLLPTPDDPGLNLDISNFKNIGFLLTV